MEAEFCFDLDNNISRSQDQIKDILSNYDGLIQYIIDIEEEPNLLDIGCGEGEWLKLCSDKGIKSCGIELNEHMVIRCRDMGLDVIHGDAMSLLKDIPDNNFSLITIFHILEDITLDTLNLLLIECKRILKDQGLLILETPIRDNLFISRPLLDIDKINPHLLTFTLGKIGFDGINTCYINRSYLKNEDKSSLTRIFNNLGQDLVFIITKSQSSTLRINNNNSWIKSFKLGLPIIKAAKEFDDQLRIQSINKEESIRHLTARIYIIEKHLQSFLQSKIYRLLVLISNLFKNIFSKIKVQKKMISKIILFIIRFFISVLYKIINRSTIKNSSIVFFIFKVFDRALIPFGYRFKHGKVLRKTSKDKEDIESIAVDEHKLDIHYDSSMNSKFIYEDIK